MSKIYPVTDRIILIPDPINEEKVHGMIVPDNSKEKPNYATVDFIGPNCTQAINGDRVIYPHKYGSNVKHDGKEMIIMKESDLWGIIGDSPSWYDTIEVIRNCLGKNITHGIMYCTTELMRDLEDNFYAPQKKKK